MKQTLILINLILLVAVGIYTWVVYPSLPDPVPTHFNFSGQPDAWSAKGLWSVAILPLSMLVSTALLLFIYTKPHLSNYPPKLRELMDVEPKARESAHNIVQQMLLIIAVEVNLLLAWLQLSALRVAQGTGHGIHGSIILVWTGLFLAGTIHFMVRMHRLPNQFREASAPAND